MKISNLIAAAALLISIGGVASAQDDVTLPDRGTTEWNVNGTIGFDDNTGWQINGLWAPFINQNLQWGIGVSLFDFGAGMDTSGFANALVNWHFPSEGSNVLPYVGAGVGGAFGDASGSVWNIHAGLKYFVSSDVAITGELQYLNFSDAIAAGGDDSSTQLVIGVSVFR